MSAKSLFVSVAAYCIISADGNAVGEVCGRDRQFEAIDANSSDTNHAGWTLAVVYENASHPLRNLTLWGGGTVVSLTAGSTDVSLTGFKTPSSLPITGKLFVSAQEGDAVIAGDRMYFGRTTSGLFPLSGPNNPVGNFLRRRSIVRTARSTRATRSAHAMRSPRRG